MELDDNIFNNTVHEERLSEVYLKRNIQKHVSTLNKISGDQWYSCFLKQHADPLRYGRRRIQNANCHTWCTVENFQNMHTSLYDSMVEADIVILLEKVDLTNKEGTNTLDTSKQFGRKTR
jgi:hypothetical protein